MSGLIFTDGALENMLDDGENGILISKPAAETLGARLGDDVVLFLTSDSGQYNTATLYIKGIFDETSLFGYVAYMRQEDLNRLLLWDPGLATDIAVYAETGVNYKKLVKEISASLDQELRVLPYMATKTALHEELSLIDWEEGPVLAPLSLDAHLDQISNLLDAFLVITWFVLVLFLFIVMIGILNTYRVLVYERTQEIGTMRALGMSRKTVQFMFLSEAALLAIISSMLSFVISVILLYMFNFIDIGSLPGAGLFTEQGLLKPYIHPGMVVLSLVLMIAAVVIAVTGPAKKAASIAPAEALRTEQ